jgi:hypothetical protein
MDATSGLAAILRDGPLRVAPQSLTEKATSIFRLFLTFENESFSVMAGLDPAIHAFLAAAPSRRGCPAQGRA